MHHTQQVQLFGADNQQRLLESRVLVVGVGNLGCPLSQLLSSVSVGTLGLVDFDKVETHNLHRQFLFDEACIGMLKTNAAVTRLRARNPQTVLHACPYALTADNVFSTIADYDAVVDGTDNFSVRYLLSDAYAITRKPLVYGALYYYEGQMSVFNVEKNGYMTSYRDLFPIAPQPNEMPTRNGAGILPTISSMITHFQANEVVKLLIGDLSNALIHTLLLFNAQNY